MYDFIVTGLDAPPVAKVSTVTPLTLSVTPTSATAEEEPIEIVVTATRTEEDLQNVPRSVTVIERDQIQEQARFGRDLADILTQLVPGSTQPTGRPSNFGLRAGLFHSLKQVKLQLLRREKSWVRL